MALAVSPAAMAACADAHGEREGRAAAVETGFIVCPISFLPCSMNGIVRRRNNL
jgi:hypothetical protein